MGKYDPLAAYLRRRGGSEIEMSFAEIELVIRGLLPKRARRPEWWTGETCGGRQAEAWAGAGYRATLLRSADRVRFRKG